MRPETKAFMNESPGVAWEIDLRLKKYIYLQERTTMVALTDELRGTSREQERYCLQIAKWFQQISRSEQAEKFSNILFIYIRLWTIEE